MDSIVELIQSCSKFIEEYNPEVSVAISVSILVIFGGGLNGFIHKHIQQYRHVIRWLLFTLICIFVYGLLFNGFAWVINEILEQLNRKFLAPIVVVVFLILGYVAEKNNK
jgi:hypothetical protein